MTAEQQKRTEATMNGIAGERLTLKQTGNTLYAYGSELGTLRLLKAYRETKTARQNYSENLETFYFALDLLA